MKQTLDELYRRTAVQRSPRAIDTVILTAATVQARQSRARRQWRQIAVALSVVAAASILLLSSHPIGSPRDKVSAHYGELTRRYLFTTPLQTTTSEEAVLNSRTSAPE